MANMPAPMVVPAMIKVLPQVRSSRSSEVVARVVIGPQL